MRKQVPEPVLSPTKYLTDIEVDYGHENLHHSKEVQQIAIKYEEIKEENGARWRTPHRFESGRFFSTFLLTFLCSPLKKSLYYGEDGGISDVQQVFSVRRLRRREGIRAG
jgi:hypothetical protein